MTYFHVRLEYDNFGDLSDDRLERIVTGLASYHPAIGGAPNSGRIYVSTTFPAESAPQAVNTALAVVGSALVSGSHGAGPAPINIEVLTEEDFDRREGWEHIPELVSGPEAAELLGVSPQRIRQMIDEGKFQSAQRIGERAFAIARSEVARMAAAGMTSGNSVGDAIANQQGTTGIR